MGREQKRSKQVTRGPREEIGSKQAQIKSKMKFRYGIAMTRNDTRIYEYNCLEQRKSHVKNIEVSVEDRQDRCRD